MDKDLQIDAYFKGFHVGFGHPPQSAEIKEIALSIEELLTEGFKPSWNSETNKEVLNEETPLKSNPTAPQEPLNEPSEHTCEVPEHNNAKLIQGTSKTKFYDNGNPKKYWYHMVGKTMCFGKE